MNEMILVLAVCGIAGCAAGAAWYAWQYASGIHLQKVNEREHMDPLPPLVRIIWPFVAYYMNLFGTSEKEMTALQARIDAAGLHYTIRPKEFIGLRFAVGTLGFLTGVLCALCKVHEVMNLPFFFNLLIGTLFGLLGFIYPDAWLKKARKVYLKSILRSLPSYLDMITMCCEAGLNLHGAIQQAVLKGEPGPLRSELERVLREIRTGVNRTDALKNMADRMDNPAMSNLVSNIIQSEMMGASLATTLRSISELRRMERFQVAEKAAMEAPVKMIFPLVMFIFPVTFMIIMFPIVMKAREML